MTLPLLMPHGDVPPRDFLLVERNSVPGRKAGPRTVLVVDDEPLIADTLAEILNDSGNFAAVAVYGAARALEQLSNSGPPDVIITDVVMPEMNGIQLARAVRSICPNTRVVLLSGQAQTRDLVEQAEHEGYRFELWAKPIHPRLVLELLSQDSF